MNNLGVGSEEKVRGVVEREGVTGTREILITIISY